MHGEPLVGEDPITGKIVSPAPASHLASAREVLTESAEKFDGADYVPERDDGRLTGQVLRVFDVMKDGEFRSLAGISREITRRFGVVDPEASISAQLRHLRKDRFGAHGVDREHRGMGLYVYRLVVNKNFCHE